MRRRHAPRAALRCTRTAATARRGAALRTEWERAATHVRWSRGTHWQCPRDVREAARSRALLLGGRGMPVMNDDVWGLIFAYLTDGEHERRPLRKKGAATAMVGACCAGGEAVAPVSYTHLTLPTILLV